MFSTRKLASDFLFNSCISGLLLNLDPGSGDRQKVGKEPLLQGQFMYKASVFRSYLHCFNFLLSIVFNLSHNLVNFDLLQITEKSMKFAHSHLAIYLATVRSSIFNR